MSTQQASSQQIIVNIGGMGCVGCANTIQDALEDMEGVVEVAVDLENDTASVNYHSDSVSINDLEQSVEEAGYSFGGIK